MDYKKKHQATRPHLWPCTKFQNFFVIMEYEQQWGEMRTTCGLHLNHKTVS